MTAPLKRCPICTETSRAFGAHGDFSLAQCERCHHSFVVNVPTPEQLDAVYARYSYDTQHLDAMPPFLHGLITERVRTFEPYRRSGRLLDVGFGAGALLRVAKELGWKPHGIETSPLAVDQANANGLGTIILGDFVDAPFEAGHFDVIVMSELIEHLPDPMRFLRQARRLLAPRGLLYMTTPHGRGISGRVLKHTWSVCAPPEHLHLFSQASMRTGLEQAGFNPVRSETSAVHPHELLEWARRPFRRAREDFEPSERVEGSYRLNAALVGSPWGRFFKRAANRVLNLTNLGDGLIVYATAGRSGHITTAPLTTNITPDVSLTGARGEV